MKKIGIVVLLLWVASVPLPAWGSAFDVLGVNPRAIALGGAYTALVDDPAAVYYNPAALTRIRNTEFDLFFYFSSPTLSSGLPAVSCPDDPQAQCLDEGAILETFGQEEGQKIIERFQAQEEILNDLENPINAGQLPEDLNSTPSIERINAANEAAANPQAIEGYTLAIASQINEYLSFGLLFNSPLQQAARQKLILVTDPYYLDFDNRAQRGVILPAFGLRLPQLPWASLGMSISLLQSTSGETTGFFPLDDPNLSLNVITNVKVDTRPKFNFGLLLTPGEDLSIAFNYFEETSVAFQTSNEFGATILGIAEIGIPSIIEANALFTPRQVTGGFAWDPVSLLTLSFDLEWEQWKEYKPPYPRVTLLPSKNKDPIVEKLLDIPVNQPIPILHFRNTFNPRVGIEFHPRKDFALRAGYAYQPTPAPEQTFSTNILDANTHVFSGGIGTTFSLWKRLPFVPDKVSIDFYGQYFYLPKKLVAKSASFFQSQELTCRIKALPNDNVTSLLFQSYLLQGMIRDEYTTHECDQDDPNTPDVDESAFSGVFETTNPGYPVFQLGGNVVNVGFAINMQF